MPIDINMLRVQKGGDPDAVRASEAKRYPEGEDPKLVDKIMALDEAWVQLQGELDTKRMVKNTKNKEVGKKKKAKEPCDDLVAEAKALGVEVLALEAKCAEAKAALQRELPKVGNLVHESVIVSCDEDNNQVVSTFGEFKSGPEFQSHNTLLWRIGGYEPDRGVGVAGHRGYFLTGPGVTLSQALQMYAVQFLGKRGFTPVQPPYFMNKETMGGVAQLEEFDEALYHVGDGTGDDKYLIATSEQPLCAFHQNDIMQESELPKRYAGVSTCFRKEAGKAGKDTWGIFRVHQFDKVEQFVVCKPEESWEMLEEMRKSAEEFLQSLEIPYQTVNIVSGELNNAAAKKYDVEAWFPGYKDFKELVSASNCTDYQARAMNTRCGVKMADEKLKRYCHFLNATLCALTRTICAIMENHQDETGVKVPEVLVPFTGGITHFPFVREARENETAKKQEKKKQQAKKGGNAKPKPATAAPPAKEQ